MHSTFRLLIVAVLLLATTIFASAESGSATNVLTSFDFDVVDIVVQLPKDYTVRAELSGPAFQAPLTLLTKSETPFNLPALAVNGRYPLANIRLVDGKQRITTEPFGPSSARSSGFLLCINLSCQRGGLI